MSTRLLHTLGMLSAFSLSALAPALAIEPPAPHVHPRLEAHQAQFGAPQVIRVSAHVSVAHAYSMSNIIMIEGDTGIFIFDTGMQVEKAEEALSALREVTDKPILGVAFSHGHGDHTGGVRAFIPDGSDIPLYAHRNAIRYLADINSPTSPIFRLRAIEQLGMILPVGEAGTVGSGGGPVVQLGGTVSYIRPTHLFDDEVTIHLGGVSVTLFHAPGDLDDGIAAWIAEDKVLLTGDTVTATHTVPILSTPRYEKGRDARAYIASMNRFRSFEAEHLIGGHGDPVSGRENVAEMITRHLLAGQFILDETLRQITEGRTPEQISHDLRLPDAVSGGYEFGDYYHRLKWIVRGVYNKEMGWYGGDPLELVEHSPSDAARRLVDALGGADATLQRGQEAYDAGDYRWAGKLATDLLTLDPDNENALTLKAYSLRGIAYHSDSANERNYLLSEANLMLGEVGMDLILGRTLMRIGAFFTGPSIPDLAAEAPSSPFIEKLGVRVDPARAADLDLSLTIHVTDRDERFQISLLDGVMIAEDPSLRASEATVKLTHKALVLLADGHLAWDDVADSSDVSIEGETGTVSRFMNALTWR